MNEIIDNKMIDQIKSLLESARQSKIEPVE